MFSQRRFLFSGQLVLKTAMHIGGGRELLISTDSPVVRTSLDQPFIPGSSLKGVFRSTVEKMARNLPSVRSCLSEAERGCIGPQGKDQSEFNKRREAGKWDDTELLSEFELHLCDTCQLFGSPFKSSKIFFADLYPSPGMDPLVQIRDGVAIDRDSEKAVDKLKFDYEVVESQSCFDLEVVLDDPSDLDLGLTCIGFAELMNGFFSIGGKRSGGLGRCVLNEFKIYHLDLTDPSKRVESLRIYLLGGSGKAPLSNLTPQQRMTPVDKPDAFLRSHIENLLKEKGELDA